MTRTTSIIPRDATLSFTLGIPILAWSGIPLSGQIDVPVKSLLLIGGAGLLSVILLILLLIHNITTKKTLKRFSNQLAENTKHLDAAKKAEQRAEREAQTAEERFQKVLDLAEIGIFKLDRKENCTYINRSMQKISGLYPKKALKEGIWSTLHPDDAKRLNSAWKAFRKGKEQLSILLRFRTSGGQKERHALCRANRIVTRKKEVEGYVGWVMDISDLNTKQADQARALERDLFFIGEISDGFFRLAPPNPIPLSEAPENLAKTILQKAVVVDCDETFASFHATTASKLRGKHLSEVDGGCGPLKNAESIQQLIDSKFLLLDIEYGGTDAYGNLISLTGNVVGIVENGSLVAIWGNQRNVSGQKQKTNAIVARNQFLLRILDTLPAEVSVRDTRCRFLHVNETMSKNTGIPKEDCIGKTIFELRPDAPKDLDAPLIEVMKRKSSQREERRLLSKTGKERWQEVYRFPLVSEAGLVEGVVEVAFDVSRRKRSEKALTQTSEEKTQKDLEERNSRVAEAERMLQQMEQACAEEAQRREQVQSQYDSLRKETEQLREQLAEAKAMAKIRENLKTDSAEIDPPAPNEKAAPPAEPASEERNETAETTPEEPPKQEKAHDETTMPADSGKKAAPPAEPAPEERNETAETTPEEENPTPTENPAGNEKEEGEEDPSKSILDEFDSLLSMLHANDNDNDEDQRES